MFASYSTSGVTCTTTSCSVNVAVNKRDLGRATRWGCLQYATIVYSPNTSSVGQYCYNPKQFDWNFIFSSTISASHGSDVTVTIYVVPGG